MKKNLPKVHGIFLIFLVLTIVPVILSAQKIDISKLEKMKARSIGPAGMSGRIVAIDAVVSNPSIIYAGSASGGVWKSTDGGTTWKPVFDDQKIINIGALKVCQSNPDVIWVGTGEGNPRNSVNIGGGVYKSLDAGRTWKLVGLENTKNIHRILIDPRDENTVYVGAIGNPYGEHPERGVYKTTDGGETWEQILYVDEKTGVGEMVMDPKNPNKLFVNMWQHRRWPWFFESGGAGSGLYVTLDSGKNWKKLNAEDNGLPKGDLGRMGLAIAPSDPQIVYALIESKKNALYKSIDGGHKFKKINDRENIGNRPFYYYEIYVDPVDSKRLYSMHGRITMSDDGGRSFTDINGGTHVDHHALWINPNNPKHLIEGNDGGLNISMDQGNTWRFIETLPVGQFYHVRCDNEIPYNVYGGMQDNGSWKGPGYVWKSGGIINELWQEVMFGDGFDVLPDPDDSRYGYAMYQQGNLSRYDSETGYTYTIKPTAPDLETKLRFHWNAPIEQDPFDNNTIYYGSQFVHKSTDKGLTWEIISPDLTTNDTTKQKQDESGGLTYDVTGAENHTCLLTIAVSPLNREVIWAGTDDGNVQLTRDGGQNWTNVSNGLKGLPEGSWIPQIRVSKHEPGETWVVANNYRNSDFDPYVYHTTDFGKSWRRVADESKVFGYALCILQDPVMPDLVWLGTEHGLWISIDKGESWARWTHGIPAVSTMDLDFQEREADLIIGTFGRSIYILDDIRPLRHIASTKGEVLNETLALFPAGKGIMVNGQQSYSGSHFPADATFKGANKPTGARINVLINAPADAVKSEEKDGAKELEGSKAEKEKTAKTDSLKILIYDSDHNLVKTLKRKPENGLNVLRWSFNDEGVKMPSRGSTGGSTVYKKMLPGSYKVVACYKEVKDSIHLEVISDPRIPKSEEVLRAQGLLVEELSNSLKVLRTGTQRLNECNQIAAKVSTQLKGLEGDDIRDLEKSVKSIRDSIKSIQNRIFGKSTEGMQGLIRQTDVTFSRKTNEAVSYINSRPGKPTVTETRLVSQSQKLIRESLDEINRFLEEQWPEFRKKVEETEISIFKDYTPLQLE